MTQEEILEGNKLIADFIGFVRHFPYMEEKSDLCKFYYYPYINKVFDEGLYTSTIKMTSAEGIYCNQCIRESHHIKNMQFHKSWSWLMPVVKECLNKSEENLDEWEHYYEQIDDSLFQVEISQTWAAVVEFIKWYNQNKENE